MVDIPKEMQEKQDNAQQKPKTPRKWLHFTTVLITTIVLYYFKFHHSPNDVVISSPVVVEPASVSIQTLDINEEEYLKLGLTPTKPIKVTSILGDHRSKTLHGRFLHITDIHPDAYYKEGADIEENACHRGKPGKGERGASKYGDAILGCDSPLILMNETLEWIQTNLRDKIDFVIWTGDNIRHDNDRKIPRTEMAIFDMNRLVAETIHDIFHGDAIDPRHYDVPVIPSLGNNDVYPHNLFAPGPTLQTREMWTIWQSFIPEEQLHIFERGAYFFHEVIPNQLAVMSINTLYLFKSNPLVDSCDKKKDPGFKLFTWLGVTLEELRQRKMKVWLSGHVPPIAKNYDITCYRKFAIWLHEYRDVIIGGVYGHMNVDHFIPVDSTQAYNSFIRSQQASSLDFTIAPEHDEDEDSIDLESLYLNFGFNVSDNDLNAAIAAGEAHALGGRPTNKENYMNDVRSWIYAKTKNTKKAGDHAERYSIVNVAASIIPTFNPGFRVWEYNITGLEDSLTLEPKPWTEFFQDLEKEIFDNDDDDEDQEYEDDEDFKIERKKGKKGKKGKKKKGKSKPDKSLPKKKPVDAPLGPGYTPQLFSPTKFVQYYLDLEAVNQGEKPFEYEVEYKSTDSPFNLKSLLVEDFIELARKLGEPVSLRPQQEEENENLESTEDTITEKSRGNKLAELWNTYVTYAFVSTGYHDPA